MFRFVRPHEDMLIMNILTYAKNVKTSAEFDGEGRLIRISDRHRRGQGQGRAGNPPV